MKTFSFIMSTPRTRSSLPGIFLTFPVLVGPRFPVFFQTSPTNFTEARHAHRDPRALGALTLYQFYRDSELRCGNGAPLRRHTPCFTGSIQAHIPAVLSEQLSGAGERREVEGGGGWGVSISCAESLAEAG